MSESTVSNRILVVILVILIVSWFFVNIIIRVIFPTSWYPILFVSLLVVIFGISLLGSRFMQFQTKLQDERTMQVSDKAARNGFGFILYGIPIAIISLYLIDVSPDTLLALAGIWVGSVVFAIISAVYYYRK